MQIILKEFVFRNSQNYCMDNKKHNTKVAEIACNVSRKFHYTEQGNFSIKNDTDPHNRNEICNNNRLDMCRKSKYQGQFVECNVTTTVKDTTKIDHNDGLT